MPSVSRHSSKPAKAVLHAPLTGADVRKIFYGLMLGMFLSALNQTIVAGVAGPALGGIIAEHWHWSMIFWLNVPFGLVAILLTYHAMKRLPRHERPHQLDIVGAALMIAAATLFLIALTSGGTRVPWMSPTILILMAASLALGFAFLWWLRMAREPFLPLTVVRNPVMRDGTAATSRTLGAVI